MNVVRETNSVIKIENTSVRRDRQRCGILNFILSVFFLSDLELVRDKARAARVKNCRRDPSRIPTRRKQKEKKILRKEIKKDNDKKYPHI